MKKIAKKRKHNYTSELELKSLLIRIKNEKDININYDQKMNSKINKYIKYHTNINSVKYEGLNSVKQRHLKSKLKNKIIDLSEITTIDKQSYEHFGHIIMLMIKNILRKPQFSGYTYTDDFYSDAVYKILKYLYNFDHKLISKRTNQPVNAFAYISQIIHNSIIYVLNQKKKEQDRLNEQVKIQNMQHSLYLNNHELIDNDKKHQKFANEVKDKEIIEEIKINKCESLYDEVKNLKDEIERADYLKIIYPHTYTITFEEYDKIGVLLKGKVSIIKEKVEEQKGDDE